MMQDQLDKSRAETEGIKKMKQEVEGVLEGLSQAKLAEEEKPQEKSEDVQVVEEGQDVWECLEKEFG